eukprot:s878_g8.t1
MFRLLLTDSGHYMLPTDKGISDKVPGQAKREAVLFCTKAAARSTELWDDVHPRVQHCFMSSVGMQAGVDRGENGQDGEPLSTTTTEVHQGDGKHGKLDGDGVQLERRHHPGQQPVESPSTCLESIKKVRFEQPPQQAEADPAMDTEPKHTGGGKDPQERLQERMQARPSLEFTMETCWEQSRHQRGYGLEQPWGSAMWNPSHLNPLDLEAIPDSRKKQRVDQCMHGAVEENGKSCAESHWSWWQCQVD